MSEASKPLLPFKMAENAKSELQGFVSTLLYARDVDTREAILRCLFDDDTIVKGPFIDLKLPFKSTTEAWPLDKRLDLETYKPYVHQLIAYKALQSQNPQNTLITTPTGSGKSECFIMPVLDYVLACKDAGKTKGVKALIMYPMNALIEDQGERLCELASKLNENLPADMHIRIGRYTGSNGNVRAHDKNNPKQIIDHRETLCVDPPDILLTNYRMLDFMLIRPQEQGFWGEDTREVFKYLILDELHTFDGAQGADVASLIRRLRLKIDSDFCCVGTSATVGDGKDQSVRDLCEFASTLFGSKFAPQSVIAEDRLSPSDVLQKESKALKTPTKPVAPIDLVSLGSEAYGDYVANIIENWSAPKNMSQLAEWIRSHPVSHKLLDKVKPGILLEDLADKVGLRADLLGEYLDILAYSRNSWGSAIFPLNTQVWVQAVPFLLRRLSEEPEFIRPHSKNFTNLGTDVYLPAVNCRECGLSGWLTSLSVDPNSDAFSFETAVDKIRTTYFNDNNAAFVFPKTASLTEQFRSYHAVPGRNWLYREQQDGLESFEVVLSLQNKDSLTKKLKDRGLGLKCPSCETANSMGLSFFGDSMMGSVLTNTFLATGANPVDKKYLIFNDSVQDTAHQAGYLSARGFRFNFRRFVLKHINREKSEHLTDVIKRVKHSVSELWNSYSIDDSERRDRLTQLFHIIPKDLWERWAMKSNEIPFGNPKNLKELLDRVDWEAWSELTIQSELGWSLRKTTLVALEPADDLFKNWKQITESVCVSKAEWQIADVDSFVYGLIRRLVTQGALFREDLNACYEANNFSFWPLTREKPHLAPLLFPRSPRILHNGVKPPSGGRKRPIIYLAEQKGHTWFKTWGLKHGLPNQSIGNFYSTLFDKLASLQAGVLRVNMSEPDLLTLSPDRFKVHWKTTRLMRCGQCNHMGAVAVEIKHMRCTQMHCKGTMLPTTDEKNALEEKSYLIYMARQYERALIAPLAHPHTGQLEANDRRKVEQAFKRNLLAGDSLNESGKGKPYYNDHPINILTCTPTMEMGIDIGTLSGVALRSFPRTLSNARQRLGRSGRSSGNSFDAIVTQLRPHDNHYWENPREFFEGPIATPGCEFRNKQLLLRQFNAYCLDEFAKKNPTLAIPKGTDEEHVDLAKHPYYDTLFEYLEQSAGELVLPFLGAVELGLDKSGDFEKEDHAQFLKEEITKRSFIKGIKSELKSIMRERKQLEEEQKQAENLEKNLDESANLKSKEEFAKQQEKAAQARKKQNYANWLKNQVGNSDYILKRLADRGLLPNYAFPEEGVRLDYVVKLPVNNEAQTYREKFKFKNGNITRPPMQALRELAPGSHYYVDGYKVPVTRLASDFKKTNLFKFLCCDSCGTLVSVGDVTQKTAECPQCRETDKEIVDVLDFQAASSQVDFSRAQITDQEEKRELVPTRVETFINYSESEKDRAKHDSQMATWVSPKARLAVEFITNAKIHHLNRNLRQVARNDEAQYYELCAECMAVPVKYEGKNPQFTANGQNNHATKCSYRKKDGVPPTIKVALGREFRSDAIRFLADTSEHIHTLNATLLFAMKTYLKGSPAHLVTEPSRLKLAGGGYKNIVTLYDNVPGGTGHLRSLMQFKGASLDRDATGLKVLNQLLKQTEERLRKCECGQGCYNCLLCYENQYVHEKIDKEYALTWLSRFTETLDWDLKEHPLSVEVTSDYLFDSAAEDNFGEGLADAVNTIPEVARCTEIKESYKKAFEIVGKKEHLPTRIVHTAYEEVDLKGAIPYTKPDFTAYKDGNPIGFIYIDGKKYHLSPDSKTSIFESQDVKIRLELLKQYDVPVLTFSYDMVEKWRNKKDFNLAGRFQNQKLAKQLGGRELNKLLVVIFSLAFPESESTQAEIKAEIEELMATFTAYQLSNLINGNAVKFLSSKELSELRQWFQMHKSEFRYGGLSFNTKDGRFEMDASLKSRVDDAGEIKEDFKLSWELFWMLWQIDPGFVQLPSNSKR